MIYEVPAIGLLFRFSFASTTCSFPGIRTPLFWISDSCTRSRILWNRYEISIFRILFLFGSCFFKGTSKKIRNREQTKFLFPFLLRYSRKEIFKSIPFHWLLQYKYYMFQRRKLINIICRSLESHCNGLILGKNLNIYIYLRLFLFLFVHK